MSKFINNHFAPQLVLRRFSDKISTYNVNTNELIKDTKCEKVFVEKEMYPTELEKLFNKNIESKFANIFNNKILKTKDNCELTRLENHIIKKFLLIAQMRTLDSVEYLNFEKTFMQTLFKLSGRSKLPINEKIVENETPRERWLRNLRVILESDSVDDMKNHEDVTNEAYRWANIYYSGYLAIWDNSLSGEDFIITDNGMTSEQDIQYYLTGINAKKQYLINKLSTNKNSIYRNILYAQQNFHENFLMFSVSKNRMIVIINPFYRLYDKKDTPSLAKPKIWPTGITNHKLFEKNEYKYINGLKNGKIIKNINDLFIYKIHDVHEKDTKYINALMLDRINTIVGFADLSKVSKSIYEYNKIRQKRVNYDGLVKKIKEKELL